ncbi:RHS domain-containing protein [Pseudomonas sp. BW16M2]|uniref:RHS repeat-associated core domain-containing protein n=2 Tax=Gammaproteobacteria TaxID=1236 RepID=UPI0016471540|nr:RHS repeat-associated core domain-containing protein [Pseudomonas sp. BW16M2]MBC3433988.1 RHS domain-containing protein [Pseudomonas sp. BW16M2]
MSDALWAAREGDALLHTSVMADIIGGVLEVAANVAIGALATAAVAAALGITVVTGGLGCFVLGAVVGLVVGVVMAKTGADTGLSRLCEGIGNALFPPTVQATIVSGSPNTKTNGKRAARAAGVVTAPSAPASGGGGGEQAEEQEETFLDMAKGFFSQMWRPTVASPAPNTQEAPDDKVLCTKHPPMPPQYLAEGSSKVLINGHPACRSGDRSTCEAVIVDGGLVSNNVRIGGGPIVVREIRSGKTPGIGLAITALMMLRGRGGKFYSKFGCMLVGGVVSFASSQVTAALTSAIVGSPNPVHAPTGAKILSDEHDLDFTLQAMIPLDWQRYYNSRDERREGLFGAGWSVPYEVSVRVEHDRLLYTDEQARVIDMGMIALGDAVFSAGEGISVRRALDGELLIEDISSGLYRLFEPSPQDANHLRLAKLGDRNDNRIHLDYDDLGRLMWLRDTFDRVRIKLHYSGAWPRRISHIERVFVDDDAETLASYRYDAAGDLAEVHDALGQLQRRFMYDEGRRMVGHQTANGLLCHYQWQKLDDWRVIRHWTNAGDEYHFEYDIEAGITCITDPLLRTSVRRWNAQFQIIESSNALDQTWRFHWNDERQLLAATDPEGGEWRFSYDESGNLCETIDPLGRSESTQWLEHWALPRSETNAAGATWTYRYDQHGNCIRETDPLGEVTRYRHDEHGLPLETIDATGKRQRQRWNEQGLLIEQVDCSGYATRLRYDRRGHLQSLTNALGQTSHFQHDALGRRISQELADGRIVQYRYTASGLLECFIDPLGNAEHFRYDLNGQLIEQRDNLGRPTLFTYDRCTRLVALTNSNGESYRFNWDEANRLAAHENLDGSRKAYQYDGLGQIIAMDFIPAPGAGEAPIHHRLRRDAAGRLVALLTEDDSTTYSLDPMDRLMEVISEDRQGNVQRVAFEHDACGRRTAESNSAGRLEHTYDALDNRLQTRLPDGRQLNRLVYGSGHLHQINIDGQVICDFERDRLHREVSRTQGRLLTRSQYDLSGRPSARLRWDTDHNEHLPAPWQQRFDFDDRDNLVRYLRQQPDHQHQLLMHYDATDRLLANQGPLPGQNEQYRYDAAANRVPDAGQVARHDQLLQLEDRHYRYDGFGRLSEKRSTLYGEQHMSYDQHHRLVQVRSVRGGRERIVKLHYDPLGRRIGKTEHDNQGNLLGSTDFGWDGLKLLQERCNGHLTLYVHEPGYRVLARVDGQGAHQRTLHYHNAFNGLPEQLTDSDGTLAWEGECSAWGMTLREWRTDDFIEQQNLRFQGQYLDRETGLHYNLFRYYDPQSGRFTQPDPIGLEGGINLYRYAPNPVGGIDPHGLDWSYFLSDEKGNPYYNGRASDNDTLEGVVRRHMETKGADGPRLKEGDRINRVTPIGTDYDTIRGIEDSGIREREVLGRKNPNVRGNKIYGISDAKAKTDPGLERIALANDFLKARGVSKVTQLPVLDSRGALPPKANKSSCGK